ncbi:uncharacterized protein LOC111085600 [Limulus polyphemus]|uniref:Uncharacterized protein LOC111085600 n=1 Tax=Limulus polyphemus TaxID=6850 RepID=A0ABM1SAI0_LIMPO|nr:uncharacterized protein LOC111085600 [Limulus polyphemus]
MQANKRAWYHLVLFILTVCILRVATFDTSVRMIRAVSFDSPSTPATHMKNNDDLTDVTAIHVPLYDLSYRPFSPWGGKRNVPILGNIDNDPDWDQDHSDAILTKRQFEAWGGKRDVPVETEDDNDYGNFEKRQFKPWGGKRNLVFSTMKRQFGPFGEKRRFNAWSGKKGFNPSEGEKGI